MTITNTDIFWDTNDLIFTNFVTSSNLIISYPISQPRTFEIYFRGKDITNIALYSTIGLLVLIFLLSVFSFLNKSSE